MAVLEENAEEDVEQKQQQGTTVQGDQLDAGHTIELHNTQASQTVVIVTESEPRSRRPADITSSATTHVASTVMTGNYIFIIIFYNILLRMAKSKSFSLVSQVWM